MLKKIFVTTTILVASLPLFAQTETEKPVKKSFNFSGYVDGYYRYDFKQNTSNNRTSFTNSHNALQLGMASMKFEGSTGKIGFVADLGMGKRANEFDYNDAGLAKGVKQLYATYAHADWLKITLGTWATHVGYELVDPNANKNYSMSYMFSWGPFSHTGIKADFTSGKSGFMIGLSNPTDFRTTPAHTKKFVIAQYSLAASDAVKLYLNYVGGFGLDSLKKRQVDLVATVKLSDKFNIGYNATYQHTQSETYIAKKTHEGSKSWWGSAVYLNLDATSKTSFTLRSEVFNDKHQLTALGAAPTGASIFANTISCNLKAGAVTFIPELRFESSKENVYYTKSGGATSSTKSLLLAAVYTF